MDFTKYIEQKAASDVKTIVLPEGEDGRTIDAARIVGEKKTARLIILGNEEKINAQLAEAGVDTGQIEVVSPAASGQLEQLSEQFYEFRKHKGMTIEKARKVLLDEIYFGTMMVKTGLADGLVAGACHSSGDTIRPALQIIKSAAGIDTVSSMFFMVFPDKTLLFADCGLVEEPTAHQLADIAVSTARTALQFEFEPRIAMLSYSTKGSAQSDSAAKVVAATEFAHEKIKKKFPDANILIDGELQFDSAYVPSVAASKCPDSPLKGNANVFIFPDLGAGNICYKATQRLAGAEAYGPILQGLALPVNDLSRGCSSEDIAATVAITAIQAQGK